MKFNMAGLNGSNIKQKYLRAKGLIILVAFLSAFIPLSMDLYLPALPGLAESFGVQPGLVNLTLVLFFVFYAAGALFWGPLSDKYGRRPILITGLAIYTVSSVFCALSGSIIFLIIFRSFQAIGAGAVASIATAIVKDVYEGPKRASALALVQSMVMVAPIIAPILGAFILGFTSWRGIFWMLAIIGIIAVAGTFALEETLPGKYEGSILKSLGRLGYVMKNVNFSSLLITFSVIFVPMFAFISASSYIFVDYFGLSTQTFGFLFAANALFSIIAPLFYIWLSKRFKTYLIIIISYITIIISGIIICLLGSWYYLLLSILIFPATLGINVIRPPFTHMLLEQQQNDTGAASSLISCGFTLFGSIGMILITMNWPDRILVLGLTYTISALIGLMLWLLIFRRPYILQTMNQER